MDWVGKLWIGNVSGDTWTDPFVCVCSYRSVIFSALRFTVYLT